MLASGEHFSGEVEAIITHEFGVGRSAVQHHLRLLREHGWVIVREDWNQRGYRLDEFVVERLEREVRHIRKRWKRRTGWIGGVAPQPPRPKGSTESLRGRRGRGQDPDDPWRLGRAAGGRARE